MRSSAVSYTHLDVYKRQHFQRGQEPQPPQIDAQHRFVLQDGVLSSMDDGAVAADGDTEVALREQFVEFAEP